MVKSIWKEAEKSILGQKYKFLQKSVCVNGGYLPFLAEIIIQYLTTSLVLLGDDIGRSATTMKSGIWW